MNEFLDIVFLVFHTSLILFNLLGWIWKTTRKANLITLLLTGGSWFLLGIFYGIGYCPLTDWHWDVLNALGVKNLPHSYIKYLVDRLTGLNFNTEIIEFATVFGFFAALLISLYLNIIQPFIKKRNIKGTKA